MRIIRLSPDATRRAYGSRSTRIRYLDTTPLGGSTQIRSYVVSRSEKKPCLIGSLEILGARGLIVPKATGYLPWLTPIAAVGLVLTMMGAILTHVRLHEAKAVGVPVVLLLLALFIAVGYFVFVPVG